MSSSRKKWIGAAAAVALVVVGAVVFTSRDKGSASDKDLIITAAVKRQTLQDKVTLSGTLGRVEQRKVNAPAEGRISRTYLDDGADVQPGQAILAIDGRDSVAEPGDFPFYRPLDVGAQGPDVKQLEQILAAAGYNPGPIDELYTEQTRFALAQWQADHNYPGRGIAHGQDRDGEPAAQRQRLQDRRAEHRRGHDRPRPRHPVRAGRTSQAPSIGWRPSPSLDPCAQPEDARGRARAVHRRGRPGHHAADRLHREPQRHGIRVRRRRARPARSRSPRAPGRCRSTSRRSPTASRRATRSSRSTWSTVTPMTWATHRRRRR